MHTFKAALFAALVLFCSPLALPATVEPIFVELATEPDDDMFMSANDESGKVLTGRQSKGDADLLAYFCLWTFIVVSTVFYLMYKAAVYVCGSKEKPKKRKSYVEGRKLGQVK